MYSIISISYHIHDVSFIFSDFFGRNKNEFFEVYPFCITCFGCPTLIKCSTRLRLFHRFPPF